MVGAVFGNRYEILEQIGSGGMAIVYKAKDRLLNRFVAVKVLRSEYKEDEEFIRRFNIESQAAASLSHTNIVPIYDVGEEDGAQYIVMEYLDGKTLKEYMVEQNGELNWGEATDFSMQICRALEHAHHKHIIHRDIKPQNIIMTSDGILKVTDFGIARAVNKNTTNMNTSAIGSAHYLSPEQARGGFTDQRSDIYSLGVVMYEMFTGQLPFDGESSVTVAMKHIQDAPVPPRMIKPNVPPAIEAIILKAMQKEQRLRYSNATQMLDDLRTAYTDPNAKIAVVDDTSAGPFETRKINLEEVKRLMPEPAPAPKKRRAKKQPTAEGWMVALAIVTSILLCSLIGFSFYKIFGSSSSEVQVPSVLNMTLEQAQDVIDSLEDRNASFTLAVAGYETSEVARGLIVKQSPSADKLVKGSREIQVTISAGPVVVELEDYTGLDYRVVEAALKQEGIRVTLREEKSDLYEAGMITRQIPKASTSLSEGDEVTLYYAAGTENTVVPDVIGNTEAEARTAIERSNLVVGEVHHEVNDEQMKGRVYRQGYAPESSVATGTPIDIYVSLGAEQETTPPTEEVPPSTETVTEAPIGSGATNKTEAEKKTKYLTLTLPEDREQVIVRVVANGVTIYEQAHSTSGGTADIRVRGTGLVTMEIYYDGEYVARKEVNFN